MNTPIEQPTSQSFTCFEKFTNLLQPLHFGYFGFLILNHLREKIYLTFDYIHKQHIFLLMIHFKRVNSMEIRKLEYKILKCKNRNCGFKKCMKHSETTNYNQKN